MKKTLVLGICIFFLIILIQSVQGGVSDATMYYTMDNADVFGFTYVDTTGKNPDQQNATANINYESVTGKVAQAREFNGSVGQLNLPFIMPTSNYSISLWAKPQSSNQGAGNGGKAVAESANFQGITFGNLANFCDADKICFTINDGAWRKAQSTTTYNPGSWYHIVAIFNGTGSVELYINGTKEATTATGAAAAGTGLGEIGGRDGAEWYNGTIDEVAFYNKTLSPVEIAALYNGGNGFNPYGSAGSNINITQILSFTTGESLNANSFPLNFNLLANASINLNCSIYHNASGTMAINESANFSLGKDINVSLNITSIAAGHYDFLVSCYNGSDIGLQNINTTNITIYIDTTDPALVHNFTDKSLYFNENITGQFNISDTDNVFSLNVSIDGNQIFGKTGINLQKYVYNLSHPNNLTRGNHTLRLRFADGHTAKELKDRDGWNWRNGLFNDYLKFEWEEPYNKGEVTIKSKYGGIGDDWSAVEGFDRFRFLFEPTALSDTYTFEVESDMPIYIMENEYTDYKKWIVIDDHWLDFHLPDEPGMTIDIQQGGNSKEVEVTIANVDPTRELFEFNSVGDLNIVTQELFFNTTNSTLSFSNPVVELQEQTITFTIFKGIGIVSTEAALIYNNSQQNVTRQSDPDKDIYSSTLITPQIAPDSIQKVINWSYNITGVINNESGFVVANQTIQKILIDNCSTFGVTGQRSLNFTLKRQSDNSPLSGSMDGNFRVWVDSESNFRTFNLTWNGGAFHGVCISPNSSTYEVFAQIEYRSPGYAEKTYYLNNATLTNVSRNISLYLDNGTSLVTFTVLDENDDELQGVIIKVLAYDIGTDSYVISEILQTDDAGQAQGHIILSTTAQMQFYKFILERNFEQIFESDPTTITSTSKTFRVTLGADYFADYSRIFDMVGDVYFTNSSLTFTFTFSDTTNVVQTGCLRLVRRSVNGDRVLNNTCVSSAAGTINVPIPETVGSNTYIGTGYVIMDNADFILDEESVSFDQRYKEFGLEGIFITFLITLTLAMIGVSSLNPAIAVALFMIGFIASVIATVFFMNWTALIAFIIIGGVVMYRVSR